MSQYHDHQVSSEEGSDVASSRKPSISVCFQKSLQSQEEEEPLSGRIPWELTEDETEAWSGRLSTHESNKRQFLPPDPWLGGAMTNPRREEDDDDFGPSFSRASRAASKQLEHDLQEADMLLRLRHESGTSLARKSDPDSPSRMDARERLYAQPTPPRPRTGASGAREESLRRGTTSSSPYRGKGEYGRALWERSTPKKGVQSRGLSRVQGQVLPEWAGKVLEKMRRDASMTPNGPCGKFIPCGPCGPDPGSRMSWFPRNGSEEDFLPPSGGWGSGKKNRRSFSHNLEASLGGVPARRRRDQTGDRGPWSAKPTDEWDERREMRAGSRPVTSPH